MKQFDASKTASMVAALRAAYEMHYQGSKIYSDQFGFAFTTLDYKMLLFNSTLYHIAANTYYKQLLSSIGWIVGRSRFVVDELVLFASAHKNHQVVILGAGYDAYFLKPEIVDNLDLLFEVDHPATMKRKQKIIQSNKWKTRAKFVPVDFEKQFLFDELSNCNFNPKLPTFFVWMGNLMYLSKDAVNKTLGNIKEFCKSEIKVIFDYMDPLVIAPNASSVSIQLRNYVARNSEPWINAYTQQEIEKTLNDLNFTVHRHLLEEDQQRLYFDNYPGLQPTQGFRWILAGKC